MWVLNSQPDLLARGVQVRGCCTPCCLPPWASFPRQDRGLPVLALYCVCISLDEKSSVRCPVLGAAGSTSPDSTFSAVLVKTFQSDLWHQKCLSSLALVSKQTLCTCSDGMLVLCLEAWEVALAGGELWFGAEGLVILLRWLREWGRAKNCPGLGQ